MVAADKEKFTKIDKAWHRKEFDVFNAIHG